MKNLVFALLVLAASSVLAQSPNIQGSVTRLDASSFQTRSERGQNGGYAPLGSYVAPVSGPQPVINPKYLFPDFATSPDNTIWVKSGTGLVPLGGITVSSGNITANNIFTGAIDTGVYGIKIVAGSYPLLLRGGSGNRVLVEYGQTIGGADSGRTGLVWYVGPTGAFKFLGGEFNGNLDFKSHTVSNATTIAGTTLTVDYGTPTLTSSSGDITVVAPTNKGLIVPSTATSVRSTHALNVTSADILYGRKDLVNTWDLAQTFSTAPIVPDSSFSIAKVSGLQSAIDDIFKKDGSVTLTGNLSAGGHRLTGLGAPTQSGDAVTLTYLTSNYVASPVASLTIQAGSPLAVSASTGAVTLSMTQATTSTPGFVTAADWNTFNGKQGELTPAAPISISGATISIPQSTASVDGYLASADFVRFRNASSSSAWADGELVIGNTSTGQGVKSTITAGQNVTITNGAGAITVAVSPGGVSTARVSSRLTASTTQTDNTTNSATSLYSYAVPANTVVAGDVVRFRVAGNFVLEGGQTISMVVKLGATTLFTISLPGGAFTPSSSETPYVLDVLISIRTAGAGGTVAYSATLVTPTQTFLPTTGTASMDTTASKTIDAISTISAITGANHISAEQGTVHLN